MQMERNQNNNSKKAKIIFIIIFVSILGSFFHIYAYALPDYRELFNPYQDRTNSHYTRYFQLCEIAKENIDPGNNVLFIEYDFLRFAQPYLYPNIICKYFKYINGVNDIELLDYMKENIITYVLILNSPFHLASNTTLFTKIEINFLPTSYLLQVNRSAL